MSIVRVTTHSENIRNILYQPPPPPPKSPRYQSIFKKDLRILKVEKKHATMGPPDGEQAVDSSCFLKRGEGPRVCAAPTRRTCLGGARPPIPSKDQLPAATVRVEKDHRNENIRRVVHSSPSQPQHRLVDSCDGHTFQADKLAFVRVFSSKYGRMPDYLVRRNLETRREEENYRKQLENKQSLCTYVSEEERKKLLDGLKENWAKLQKIFLRLPMLTDTQSKILKRCKMENQLRQLEKDIKTVEENPFIYIYD